VRDCVQATVKAARAHEDESGTFVYNVGTDETHTVDDSIAAITEHLAVSPRVEYAGGGVGDSPVVHLDIARIAALAPDAVDRRGRGAVPWSGWARMSTRGACAAAPTRCRRGS
jgi:nucleoside-diphosphate-sugar epimerase